MAKIEVIFPECKGEAHSNPHIDYCGECMPLWGVVATCKACNVRLSIQPKKAYMVCPKCGGKAKRDNYPESKRH